MIAEEQERRARLERLKAAGHDPYPARVARTHTVADFLAQFDQPDVDGLNADGEVTMVGRVRAIRRHGGLSFVRFEDGTGEGQLMIRKDALTEGAYATLFETLDVGDFVEAAGTKGTTKTGERSLIPSRIRIIAKAILPLPEKWHGLSDTEKRFRKRELDLIANPSVRATFKARAAIVTAIRSFFDGHGFLEVDTPILQHIASGANARPFVTHHEALDEELYLRIAPELFLKRLVVGGFERVYEIARCFRNEGIDFSHNPEFSQVEAYASYMEYEELMGLMEELLSHMIRAIGKDPAHIEFQGDVLNFTGPLPRVAYGDVIAEHTGIDINLLTTTPIALKTAREHKVDVGDTDGIATVIDQIFKKLVRPNIIQPVFVIDYPAFATPLAKRKPNDPKRLEMFQLVVGRGLEVMKAFTELNDPIDQEQRMDEQEEAREQGDDEAQRRDDEFLNAMKHGMPPMAGVGMGIERITQVLTNSHNIKEVILFPTLRSQAGDESA
ncbi:MAG: lysine--tRNA ligase [Patescibacteria group bacterium]